MSGNSTGPERPIPSIDYGAGPRPLVGGLSASRRTRPDGRTAMNGWLHDQAKQLGTRREIVVIPTRRAVR